MKTMSPVKRQRFREVVNQLDYADCANMLRECIETGHEDTRAMQILAEHCWATAPTDAQAEIMLKFHTAFAAGRRIKFGTGKLLSVDGVTVEMIDEINSIEEE